MNRRLLLLFLCLACTTAKAQISYQHIINNARYELTGSDYSQAIAILNDAIELKPENFEAYYMRGYAKSCLDDFSGAIEDFDKAIQFNPLYIKAFQYKGYCNDKLKNYGEALNDFAKALEIDPFDAEIFLARASTYLELGLYQKAIDDYSFALSFKPELSPATMANMSLAYVNRGIAKGYLKQYDDALADMDKAIHYDFMNPELYFRKGLIEAQRGTYSNALDNFNQAIRIKSDNPLYIFNRAVTELQLGDTTSAMDDYEYVNLLDERNALTYYNRGIIYSCKKDYTKALEMFGLVTLINPSNINAYFNRSVVNCKLEKWNEAEKDLSKVLELYPRFIGAWINRSIVREEKGDAKGAYLDHRRAMQIIQDANGGQADSLTLYNRYADSAYFNKIIALESDFTNGEMRQKQIQYAEVNITPFPDFILSMISPETNANQKRQKSTYLDRQISLINSKGNLPRQFAITAVTKDFTENNAITQAAIDNIADKDLQAMICGIMQQMAGNFGSAKTWYRLVSASSNYADYATLNLSALLTAEAELNTMNPDNDKISITRQDANVNNTAQENPADYNTVVNLLSFNIIKDNSNPFIWYNLGNTYLQMKSYNRAIDAYSDAISLNPKLAEAYYNRALTLIFIGETTLAAADISKAGELGITEAYAVMKKFSK